MTTVSLVQTGSSPDLQSVCEHLHRSIELIGGLDSVVEKGAKVLLKPNAGTATTPEEARNTDPRVIEAMIVLLKEHGIHEIVIAESSLVGVDTMAAFKAMGLDEIARRHDVGLIDLKKMPVVIKNVPRPFVLPSVKISAIIDEVDAIINLPKLKTISALPVSLGLKNLKGLLPDSEKKRFHHTHLTRAIVDLNQIVKPCLTVIDGIIASELYEPRETDILFAGGDVLAVDVVAISAAGLNPDDIDYIALAGEAGVGINSLDRIEIKGDSLENIRLNLRQAPTSSEAFKSLFPEVEIVDAESCSGCVGSLYMSLKRAREKGLFDKIPDLTVVMGAKVETLPPGKNVLCAGNCTKDLKADHYLPGCPFTSMYFTSFLEKHFTSN